MERLFNEAIDGNIFLVAEINAKKCISSTRFCKEFRKSFMLPDNPYYDNHTGGDNIIDLGHHHNEKNYKVVVKNFKSLDDDKQKALIIAELNYFREYYSKILTQNTNNFIVEYR